MTGIQSLLVRIYGHADNNEQPWGIVKRVGQSEKRRFHNREELLNILLDYTGIKATETPGEQPELNKEST
ncbi:MAG: hypothetical protein V3V12_05145 [Gammaproteobacteria bacterium]